MIFIFLKRFSTKSIHSTQFEKKTFPCQSSLSNLLICQKSAINIDNHKMDSNNLKEFKNFEKAFFCEKSKIFISFIYVCDNINDCYDGEDEFNCQLKNQHLLFQCFDRKKEISIRFVCNHRIDCLDESDEKFCG